jgi:protein-disulfide isomerase
VDTGQARFVYRDFVLGSFPNSQKESEAAWCAGRQGKYWEMNEKLFAAQADVQAASDPVPLLKGYAKDLGVDTAAFDKCLDGGEAAFDVASDGMAAKAFGVSSTPTLFVNDVMIPLAETESMFQLIEYVGATGALPEILPQTEDFHVKGDLQAAQAAMAVFLDYSSPDAAKYATEVYPQIAQQYIDAGSLIYIFHPWGGEQGSVGYQAAVAAECAGEQAKFWEMTDQLFKDQATWTAAKTSRETFAGYAKGLSLDTAKFETCLDGDWANLRAQAGALVGSLYGATLAQTYLFGDGNSLTGAPAFDEFKTIIDGMLGQ